MTIRNEHLSRLDTEEVLLVATEATTTITVTKNNLAGLTLFDGITDAATVTLSLNEGQMTSIYCDSNGGTSDCSELELSGDKNFAVLIGDGGTYISSDSSGAFALQVPAEQYLGDTYVLVDLLGAVYESVADTVDGSYSFTHGLNVEGPHTDAFEYNPTSSDVAKYDDNVYLIQHVVDANNKPSLNMYPSVSQWGIHQFFYATEGYTYTIVIVTTVGDTKDITVTTSGITIGFTDTRLGDEGTGFPGDTFSSRKSNVGTGSVYELYSNAVGFSVTDVESLKIESGIIEFRSGESSRPFMLLIYEDGTDGQTAIMPYGIRFPTLNPCVPTTGGQTVHVDFGGNYYLGPGDLIDNDCDGDVDEEDDDGKDTDNDSEVDEDVALNDFHPNIAIKAEELWVSNTADFTGSHTAQIHSSGCNTHAAGSAFGEIGPFKHNTDLSPQFANNWVLDTPRFNAFNWLKPDDTLYFRAKFGFCQGNVTTGSLCQNSCASRRRRSATDTSSGEFVDLQLKIKSNSTASTSTGGQQKHPCSNNVVFWVPAVLGLIVVLMESVVVGVLFCQKSHIKNL